MDSEIGINDVLIEILRTGICGTDVHIYNWDAWAQKTIPVPMVIGHGKDAADHDHPVERGTSGGQALGGSYGVFQWSFGRRRRRGSRLQACSTAGKLWA